MTPEEKEAKLQEIKGLLAAPAADLIQLYREHKISGKLLKWLCGKKLFDKGFLFDSENFKWIKRTDLEEAGITFVHTPADNEPWLVKTMGLPTVTRADGKKVVSPAYRKWHDKYVAQMLEDRRVATQFTHIADVLKSTDKEDELISHGQAIGLF